jgi:peptidoglycan/LPS O-acetylase OafA/YrhL
MTAARLNLRTLDMLRGMLAVYVLIGHCRWLLWAGHAAWMAAPHSRWLEPLVYASASFRFGREAVMIFFALSGFFIHLRAAQGSRAGQELSAGAFYRRRAHRLGAPYLFALAITVVLDMAGRAAFPTLYLAATGDALIDGVFSHTGYGWPSVAPAMVVLPSSLGYDFGTNGPLWSLAYEVIYYALYPGWLALRRASALVAYGVVPAVCLAIAFLPAPTFFGIVLIYYPVWLAGAAVAEILSRDLVRIPRLVAIGACGLGFALHVWGGLALLPSVPAVLYGAGAVIVCATMGPASVTLLPVRAFEYLGVRSYSIYIVHFPFVALMAAAVFALGGRPFHGWFAAGGALAAVAFGCLCFEVCERHFIHHRVPDAKLAA